MIGRDGVAPDAALTRLRLALGGDAVTVRSDGSVVIAPQGREASRLAAELLCAQRVPWSPRGGARRPPAWSGVLLASSGLGDVFDFWREDLVCRVGAGCTFDRLRRLLAQEGMRLAADAAKPAVATLGGAFASGERGLRAAPSGGLREAVVGLTAVDGTGALMKAGARVVKNVAGFDLARLHHGAAGAFGMVLDFTLKLEPLPETTATAVFEAAYDRALELVALLRRPRSPVEPASLVWVNAGAARAAGLSERGALIAMVEGWEGAVSAWSRRAVEEGGRVAPGVLARVRDLEQEHAQRRVCSWSVAPSVARTLWPPFEAGCAAVGGDPWLVLDLQNGHACLLLAPNVAPTSLARALRTLAAQGSRQGAWMFPRRGLEPGMTDTANGKRAGAEVERRLKGAFDPHGLLPPLPQPLTGEP